MQSIGKRQDDGMHIKMKSYREKKTTPSDTLLSEIIVGGIYEHYKGHRYRVLALSCHSEYLSWYVVYEALYPNEVSITWHRPLDLFAGYLMVDELLVKRFKYVANAT